MDEAVKNVLLVYTLIASLYAMDFYRVAVTAQCHRAMAKALCAACLPKLTGFTPAAKEHFKHDIPLNDRNAWEAKLKVGAARVAELTAQIKRAEREIDQIVYRLFDLTSDEIALIEAAVK